MSGAGAHEVSEGVSQGASREGAIPVAVVGAGGFTGAELLWWLAHHPVFETVGAFASGSGTSSGSGSVRTTGDVEGRLRGVVDLEVRETSVGAVVATGARVVFLATPHGVSNELAGPLMDAGVTVIDLSGAFRLTDDAAHAHNYGFVRDAAVVERAVYGLPERSRDGLAGASLVACAGCYVTAASVALGALADAGVIDAGSRVIVDAVSGVSGAGRGASMHLAEVSAQAYGVLGHRHWAEIEQATGARVVFQPQLGVFDRGILATMHASVARGVTAGDIDATLRTKLGSEAFVRLMPEGVYPSVAGVRGTNFVDIGWAFDADLAHLVVFGAIDNLVKGASGQGIQCANAVFGIDETAGLMPGGAGSSASVGSGVGPGVGV